MPAHGHGLLSDKGLVQKSPRWWIQWELLANEEYSENPELYRCRLSSLLFPQSNLFEDVKPSANQGGVDQKVARAKYRPDSGVTVIEVPKTADM